MSSASIEQVSAMRVAEWKAEAAMTGKSFAMVAKTYLQARMNGRSQAEMAWFEISLETREIILAMVSDRTHRKGVKWSELTVDEQKAAGRLARRLASELSPTARRLR